MIKIKIKIIKLKNEKRRRIYSNASRTLQKTITVSSSSFSSNFTLKYMKNFSFIFSESTPVMLWNLPLPIFLFCHLIRYLS